MTSSPAISHGPEAAVEDGFAIAARSVHSAAAVPAGGVHCGSCRTCCVQDVQFTDQWWRCFWPDPCRFPSWILAHPRNQAGFCCLQAESLLCIQWLQLSPGAGGAALFLAGRAESVTGSTNHPLSPSYLFYRASYLFKASMLIYLSPKEQRPLRSGCKSSQPPCMQTLPSSAGAWLDPLPPPLPLFLFFWQCTVRLRPARTPRPCWRACSEPRTHLGSTWPVPTPTRHWSHASVSSQG